MMKSVLCRTCVQHVCRTHISCVFLRIYHVSACCVHVTVTVSVQHIVKLSNGDFDMVCSSTTLCWSEEPPSKPFTGGSINICFKLWLFSLEKHRMNESCVLNQMIFVLYHWLQWLGGWWMDALTVSPISTACLYNSQNSIKYGGNTNESFSALHWHCYYLSITILYSFNRE